MRLALLVTILVSLAGFGFVTSDVSLRRPLAAREEKIFRIESIVQCPPSFPGIAGELGLGDRRIRFFLPAGRHVTEVALGRDDMREDLWLEPTPCRTEVLTYETRVVEIGSTPSVDELALRHSPYVVVRENQIDNPWTDLPILMTYSRHSGPQGNLVIRYTLYFSDEDSLPNAASTEGQMTRYGRRSDIEWAYEVELSAAGLPVAHRYQGGIILGIGHATYPFRGSFLPGTDHPILYNCADHNVFDDQPVYSVNSYSEYGHHLTPRVELLPLEGREKILFSLPWIFRLSDTELKREKRLHAPSQNYLYATLRGTLRSGSLRGKLALNGGHTFYSGDGHGDLDRLGEDLWGKEGVTAIPLPKGEVQRIGSGLQGEFSFQSVGWEPLTIDVERVAFHRFDGALERTEEITAHFTCRYSGAATACRF